jgi:hypothetical protein
VIPLNGPGTLRGSFKVLSHSAGVIGLDLMYFDALWRPIASSTVDVAPSSAQQDIAYTAPVNTHYIAVAWERPTSHSGFLTIVSATLGSIPQTLGSGPLISRNGTMAWNGSYMMFPSVPIPGGAKMRFHFRGNAGTELVRAGVMASPAGKVISVAEAEDPDDVAPDDIMKPPRVYAKTLANGGSWLQLTVPSGRLAGALFLDFTNDQTNHDAFLLSITVNGVEVWKASGDSDMIRPPGFVNDRNRLNDDPFFFARDYTPPVRSDPTSKLRRSGHKEYDLVGIHAVASRKGLW